MKTVILLSLLCSAHAWGMTSEEAALGKIESMQKSLKGLSLQRGTSCDLSKNASCDFHNYCDVLAANRSNAYVYENASGQKFANFNLYFLQDQLSSCLALSGKDVDRKMPLDQDPFANPYLLMGAEGQKYNDLFQKESHRVANLVNELKERLVRLLERKKNSSNAAAIDNMISRVRRVKTEILKPANRDELLEKGCLLPNAALTSPGIKMRICPQMLGMPDGAITMVLAHELGHAIDPCSSSRPIVKWQDEEAMANANWDGKDNLVRSIPSNKNPFASTIQCLQQPQSIGIRVPTNAERSQEMGGFIQSLLQEGADKSDPQISKLEARMRDFADGEPESYCTVFQSDGEDNDEVTKISDQKAQNFQEAFADWVSSQLIGEKLQEEKDPAKAKTLAFESQLLGLQSECPAFQQDQKEAVLREVKAARCPTKPFDELFALEKSPDADDHPGWQKRSSKIFLAQPEIQKALGCQPQKDVSACK